MLTELSVRNLGTVKDATLALAPGLTVITGETGAGKSLLLTGVRLLTGGRSDARIVRSNCGFAQAGGVWSSLSKESEALLEDMSAETEDGELFVTRRVASDGKSRLTVGGASTPTKVMTEFAPNLVEIHGQSDQLKLKDANVQRRTVDEFGGETVSEALNSYSTQWREVKRIRELVKDRVENATRRDFELRYSEDLAARFEALDPQDNEIETLESDIQKISHLEEISTGLSETVALILPEEFDGPQNILAQAVSSLRKLSRYDDQLESIADAMDSALDALDPAIQEIEQYADSVDLESLQKLHELEDRLQELRVFAKPFGSDLNRAIQESLAAQELVNSAEEESDVEELKKTLGIEEKELSKKAKTLSTVRLKAATDLSKLVNDELEELSMRGVRFVVTIESATPAVHGADTVSFMVENHGSEPRPIAKAASGGELSRIMLALEVVTAAGEAPKTLIFDEVDSGVGGSTATAIGRRLSKLSRQHQVIVVTHLAQVAVYGDTQFVVSKLKEDESVTAVEEVRENARIRETARILSGLEDNRSGLTHAEELLQLAAEEKRAF